MGKKLLLVALFAYGAAGTAGAQTILDTSLGAPTPTEVVPFSISTDSELIEGINWQDPTTADYAEFIVDTASGQQLNLNKITPASGNPDVSSGFNIGPGSYVLFYQALGQGTVDVAAVALPAPELDTASTMTALTLLCFGIATLRGRLATRRNG